MGIDEKASDTLPGAELGIRTITIRRHPSRRRVILLRLFILLVVIYATRFLFHKYRHAVSVPCTRVHKLAEAELDFDWSSLTPSEEISWTPCYDEFQCARLILPLDYLSPAGVGPNATIALQMLPATDKEHFRGTILINPGGPGEAGTDMVKHSGKDIMRISGGSFNVLGFDPRGTGASTPSAQCFQSNSQFKLWQLQDIYQTPNFSDGSVGMSHAREMALGRLCQEALGGNGREDANGTIQEWGAGRFMSTPSVATDMLKITEKLGEEKLKYWGLSYGSILGQYFSAMYPDKVERVVIDGVYDGYNYREALWNSNLVDTDAVWASLPTFCHQAGPSKCSLYETTVGAIEARIDAIMKQLKEQPLAVPFAPAGPFVLTWKAILYYAFQAAYNPTAEYAGVANTLVAIEQNNQTALAEMAGKFGADTKCECAQPSPWLVDTEAPYTIACGDGEPITYSDEGYRAWYEELANTSSFGAPNWGIMYLRCAGWRIRPKWRYTGPLSAENTSHPLLLISPMYDTVCPLSDAKQVHARYGGSGLLIQNSYGHCSPSAPSLCTAKHVRAYFENGTLPEDGTVCEVDALPFIGTVVGTRSLEDHEMLDAVRSLGEAIPRFGMF